MRLVRIGPAGSETPGALVDDDTLRRPVRCRRRLRRGVLRLGCPRDALADIVAERVAAGRREPVGGRRFGAPIARPHQILCIGLNYSDHAAETGQAVPAEPILFTKSPNTLIGPNDDVADPAQLLQDGLGGRARHRHRQPLLLPGRRDRSGWRRSPATCWSTTSASAPGRSSAVGSGPRASPRRPSTRLVPTSSRPDEIGDVLDLDMWLDIDGVRRQTGSTSTMIFSPAFIVHYLSQFLALEPGDLINTGTPPGVGMGMSPQVVPARRRDHDARHHPARHPDRSTSSPTRAPRPRRD